MDATEEMIGGESCRRARSTAARGQSCAREVRVGKGRPPVFRVTAHSPSSSLLLFRILRTLATLPRTPPVGRGAPPPPPPLVLPPPLLAAEEEVVLADDELREHDGRELPAPPVLPTPPLSRAIAARGPPAAQAEEGREPELTADRFPPAPSCCRCKLDSESMLTVSPWLGEGPCTQRVTAGCGLWPPGGAHAPPPQPLPRSMLALISSPPPPSPLPPQLNAPLPQLNAPLPRGEELLLGARRSGAMSRSHCLHVGSSPASVYAYCQPGRPRCSISRRTYSLNELASSESAHEPS